MAVTKSFVLLPGIAMMVVGVCVSTAGPGAVHLLNGLYDAKFDGVPVLAITGSPPRALLGTRFTQGVDTIALYDDVTSVAYVDTARPQAGLRRSIHMQ